MITSTNNRNIKIVRRLVDSRRFRESQQLFVVEGTKWLAEIIDHGLVPEQIYATENWMQAADNEKLISRVNTWPILVSHQVMAYISALETPPGILSIMPMIFHQAVRTPELALILDRIRNPGNMGAILRTAAAAGADMVLLSPGCVDMYNPKTIQASMGAHLRLSVLQADWGEITDTVIGLKIWLAEAGTGTPYYEVNFNSPSAIIMGSEASGGSRDANDLAGGIISIPMRKATESLNVAVAAGVILFEAARQRSAAQVNS